METKSWWQKFKKNRLARLGATVLGLFYIVAIFADFVAPYDPLAQQPNGSLLPPTQVYWINQDSGQFIGPHVYPTIQGSIDVDTGDSQLEVDYSRPAPLRLFVKGHEYRLFELTLPIITRFSLDGEIEMTELEIFQGIPISRHLFGPVESATPRPTDAGAQGES